MIDVHAHFADEGYEFPAEWENIRAAGVNTVILAADTLAHAAWHARFCEEHEGAYFTVGIHPEFAGQAWDEGEFRRLAAHEKCVAVGEIGLDYHYGDEKRDEQLLLFARQLELAAGLGLPVQVHSRDACADTFAVLREHPDSLSPGFLMHCYSYGRENIQAFAKLGAYFSFGGVVCFKNARRAAESADACPSGRLLTETDSPYLSPFRGEKNSPANIPVIIKRLSMIRRTDEETLVQQTEKNAKTLFRKL